MRSLIALLALVPGSAAIAQGGADSTRSPRPAVSPVRAAPQDSARRDASTSFLKLIEVTRPRVGLFVDRSWFPSFADVVGDQADIGAFTGSEQVNSLGLFAEWRGLERFFLGGSIKFGKHEFTQRFNLPDESLAGILRQSRGASPSLSALPTGPARADGEALEVPPDEVQGSVNGWFVDAYAGYRRGPFDFVAGPFFALDLGTFLWRYGQQLEEGRRTHTGGGIRIGTGVNVGLGGGIGLRFGGDVFTSGQPGDADTHVRISVGLTQVPGTRPRPPGPGTQPRPPRPPEIPAPPINPVPTPPDDPPSTPPQSQPSPSCCGLNGQFLEYPRTTDPRVPPDIQAAPRDPAIIAAQVLAPNGAYFHTAADLSVESVGFPFLWTRHHISDYATTDGGLIGHRWDFNMDKRVLPVGGQVMANGLVREVLGVTEPKLYYFNGQGRAELYAQRRSDWRDQVRNFGTTFRAYVTIYQSPPGAFHEIERYVLADPAAHPFRGHPNIDTANGESIFFVLREKNGTRYVFNCRGMLIHILSRHDYTSLGGSTGGSGLQGARNQGAGPAPAGMTGGGGTARSLGAGGQPAAQASPLSGDSVRTTLIYGGPLNPLTQNPMLSLIRDTGGRLYGVRDTVIGQGQLDTNIDCAPRKGPMPIPRIAAITSAQGEVRYHYSASTRLDSVTVHTGPITTVTRYTYDTEYRLLAVMAPNEAAPGGGRRLLIANQYDGSGRVSRQVLGNGLLTWDLSYGPEIEARDGRGTRHAYTIAPVVPYYVIASRTVTPRNGAEGGPWRTTYEHNGATQVTAVTLPRGNRVRYAYDDANEAVTLGPIRDFSPDVTYDNNLTEGNLLSVMTEAGRIQVPNPLLAGTQYEFEPLFNQLAREVDANGNSTAFAYQYVAKGDFGNPVEIRAPALTQPDGSSMALTPVRYTYTTKGQVETIVDRRGGTTRYSYSLPRHHVSRIEYPGGGERTYTMDDAGRVLEEGGSFGVTAFSRDARGRDTLRTIGTGTQQTRSWNRFDLQDNVLETRLEIVDHFSPADTFRVGATVEQAPTPSPVTTRIASTEYDLLDRPVLEKHDAVERRFEYDAAGHLSAETNPSPTGQGTTRTVYLHDARGLLMEQTPGLNGAERSRFRYDPNGNVVRHIVGQGESRVTTYAYDAFDRHISTTDPHGTVRRVELDAHGNVLIEEVLGRSASLDSGSPTTLSRMEARWNELHRPISMRQHALDGGGVLEGLLFYDSAGEVQRAQHGAGDTREFEYDIAGRVVAVLTPDLATRTTYDAAGRTLTVTETETERQFTHLMAQRTAREVSRVTTFTYDAQGRLTHTDGPSGEVRRFFNSAGQVRLQYEPGHGRTETRYDSYGRRESVQSGSAFERTTYALSGHPVRVETPATVQTWRYDALGRVIEKGESRSGATTQQRWNDKGDLIGTTDPNGTVVTRSYSAGGLPTRLGIRYGSVVVDVNGLRVPATGGAEWETMDYDGLGRLVRTATSQGVETIQRYDGLGRLVAETQGRQGVPHTVRHAYAPDHLSAETTYPGALGGLRVRREFDLGGRTESIHADGVLVAGYEYTGADRVFTRTYGNGVLTSYEYDERRRLDRMEVSAPGGPTGRPTFWAGSVLWSGTRISSVTDEQYSRAGSLRRSTDTDFLYDRAGRRLGTRFTSRRFALGAIPEATTSGGTWTRYQDGRAVAMSEFMLDQATGRASLARVDSFTFDAAGRQVAAASAGRVNAAATTADGATYEAVARFARGNGGVTANQSFKYDPAGNLVADGEYTYTYDHRGRLTRVGEYRSRRGFNESIRFIYDALGRRVHLQPYRDAEPVGFVTWASWARDAVDLVYSGSRVIGEVVVGRPATPPTMLARYVIGGSGERVRMERHRNDDLAGPIDLYYVHEGVQGGVALLTDPGSLPASVQWDVAASAGAPFRPPGDLQVVQGTRTRSPYLSGTMRVDGFTGVRQDEVTGGVVYDFRNTRGLADALDMQAYQAEIAATQAAGVAALATMSAVIVGAIAAPAIPSLYSAVVQAGWREAASFATFGGLFGTGAGFANSLWQGTEYTLGSAAADFAEGAVLGVLGGAMAAAKVGLVSIAAVDYATGFASGFIRANPLDGLTQAATQGAITGAFGATLGLGVGVVAHGLRGTQAEMTRNAAPRAASAAPEPPSEVLAVHGGPNPRMQAHAGGPVRNAVTDIRLEVISRPLAVQVYNEMMQGTFASRYIAGLWRRGEIQVHLHETMASGNIGEFMPGTNILHINKALVSARRGQTAREVASVVVHEGMHYLGGGELSAFIAQAVFLYKRTGGSLRAMYQMGPVYQDLVYAVTQGSEYLADYLWDAYARHGRNILQKRQPLHQFIQAKGMMQFLELNSMESHNTIIRWLIRNNATVGMQF